MQIEEILIILIPLLYSLMLSIELVSTFSRFAGYILTKNALAYSLQNTTFTITRFFYIAMMPCIGYLVDTGIDKDKYVFMVISSYLLTFIFSIFIFLFRNFIIRYYLNVIVNFSNTNNIIRSMILSFKADSEAKKCLINEGVDEVESFKKINLRIFITSNIIYLIHASGVFVTFYFALSFSDNRVMITQFSGLINAAGTILLTFKLDPSLSLSIENKKDFGITFFSIYAARVFVFFVLAPSFIFILGFI